MDICELAWVTVLTYYGQQKRERAGAAACSLPGVAGEGGFFTEDILRGMTVRTAQMSYHAGVHHTICLIPQQGSASKHFRHWR